MVNVCIYQPLQSFPSPRLVIIPRLKRPICPIILPLARGRSSWIHIIPNSISSMWNANSLVQDLNSCRRVHFLRRQSMVNVKTCLNCVYFGGTGGVIVIVAGNDLVTWFQVLDVIVSYIEGKIVGQTDFSLDIATLSCWRKTSHLNHLYATKRKIIS